MISFTSAVLAASVLLLTACGSGVSDTASEQASHFAAGTVVSTIEPAAQVAPVHDVAPVTAFDGKWDCAPDDAMGNALSIEVSGNALRDTVTNATMALSHGIGIELGAQTISYIDPTSGAAGYARAMTQVPKQGYASIFSPELYGGAGAGVEFSVNANGTLKISDYSSMNGAESAGRAIPMTCRRA